MEQTREKILETAVELLADDSLNEITVAIVAERAKISVRTAYRYFPTKEALLDALNLWMRKKFGSPPAPDSVAGLADNAEQLIRYFEKNEVMLRAARTMPSRELRSRRKAEQVRGMIKITAEAAPNLDPQQVKIRAAALHNQLGSEVWLNYRDHWELTPEECIETVRWAIQTLAAQIAADNSKPKKKK